MFYGTGIKMPWNWIGRSISIRIVLVPSEANSSPIFEAIQEYQCTAVKSWRHWREITWKSMWPKQRHLQRSWLRQALGTVWADEEPGSQFRVTFSCPLPYAHRYICHMSHTARYIDWSNFLSLPIENLITPSVPDFYNFLQYVDIKSTCQVESNIAFLPNNAHCHHYVPVPWRHSPPLHPRIALDL